MLINLTDVLLNEGKTISEVVDWGMQSVTVNGNRYPVKSASPVKLEVTNQGDKVLGMTASSEFTVLIPCDRCLKDVSVPISLDFEREIDLKMSDEERIQKLDEQNYIDGYYLDVDKMLYGEILMQWPCKVLCQEDCKGICATCGQNLNEGSCDCDTADLDPRMAKIRDVFNKFKEV